MTYSRSPFVLCAALALVLVALFTRAHSVYTADAEMQNPPVNEQAADVLTVNAYFHQPPISEVPTGANLRLSLFNDGRDDLTLVGITSPYAREATPRRGGFLPIRMPAQTRTAFQPSGNDLVLRDLVRPMMSGDPVPGRFTFDDNAPLPGRTLERQKPSAASATGILPLNHATIRPQP